MNLIDKYNEFNKYNFLEEGYMITIKNYDEIKRISTYINNTPFIQGVAFPFYMEHLCGNVYKIVKVFRDYGMVKLSYRIFDSNIYWGIAPKNDREL
jgi:hypothetical protein